MHDSIATLAVILDSNDGLCEMYCTMVNSKLGVRLSTHLRWQSGNLMMALMEDFMLLPILAHCRHLGLGTLR